jgi:hypothetical protein
MGIQEIMLVWKGGRTRKNVLKYRPYTSRNEILECIHAVWAGFGEHGSEISRSTQVGNFSSSLGDVYSIFFILEEMNSSPLPDTHCISHFGRCSAEKNCTHFFSPLFSLTDNVE